ncbi:MAG: InlB B-repeat-containing protein, partial [Firmicutes bacterium]|nr:InlB B-repeat-containing protein [Bacillota bacterium]
ISPIFETAATVYAAGTLSGVGTQSSPYLINNAADWETFAESVYNDGTTYEGQYIKLTANISVSKMVGTSSNKFKGTFDGAGHTITLDLSTDGGEYTAPFRYVNGAAIKRLHTAGTVNGGNQKYAAGLIGSTDGTVNIVACQSNVTITSNRSEESNKDATHGGFIGVASGTVTFNNCFFDGSITDTSATNCGGFVGWRNGTLAFINCLMSGTMSLSSTDGSATFNRNGSSTLNNCYYKTAYGDVQGTQTSKTGGDLKALLGNGWTVDNNGNAVPDINDNNFYLAEITNVDSSYLLTGEEIKPEPIVKAIDGTVLTKDTHYTVEWSGDGKIADFYTLTVTAKEDSGYSGSQSFTYKVTRANYYDSETNTLYYFTDPQYMEGNNLSNYGCTDNNVKHIVIANTVTSIAEQAFSNNYYRFNNLESVVISKNVTSVGKNAFNGCSKLSSVTFEPNYDENASLTLGRSAFSETGITSVILPPQLRSVDNYSFGYSSGNVETVICLSKNATFSQSFDGGARTRTTMYVPNSAYARYNSLGIVGGYYGVNALKTVSYMEKGDGITSVTADVDALCEYDGRKYYTAGDTLALTLDGVTGKNVYCNNSTLLTQNAEDKYILTVPSDTDSFTISSSDKDSIALAEITLDKEYYIAYGGNAIEPSVIVKIGDTTLTEGTHYTVSYSDNTSVGTGSVIITGIGDYIDTAVKEFAIVDENTKNIADTEIVFDSTGYEYTGLAIEPSFSVTYNGETLTKDTDYTVTYSNNINDGTASVTIKGITGNSWAGTKTAEFNIIRSFEGLGTEESPYLIKTKENLARLAEIVNSGVDYKDFFFELDNDIDNIGELEQIGDGNHRFSGKFNGNNHYLADIEIAGKGGSFCGLFGYINNTSEIKALELKNVNIGSEETSYVGSIAGGCLGGKITNCKASGIVKGSINAGGIVGGNDISSLAGGVINGCTFSGEVSVSIKDAGGIAGFTNGTVKNCTVYDTTLKGAELGGIVGETGYSTIAVQNCNAVNIVFEQRYSVKYYLGYIIGIYDDGSGNADVTNISGCTFHQADTDIVDIGHGGTDKEISDKGSTHVYAIKGGDNIAISGQSCDNDENIVTIGGKDYYKTGAEVKFKVAAKDGYNLGTVKVDNEEKTADGEGYYTATVGEQDMSVTSDGTSVEYSITYKGVENAENGNPTSYTVEDDDITLAEPTKTGYTFTGWTYEGQEEPTKEVTIKKGSMENKEYTANWTANTYIVKFDKNGGTGTMTDQEFTYDTAQNLTENAFTRTGYHFAGWNTEADGTGDKSYTDKQGVNNLIADGEITLYAQWEINKYTVTWQNGETTLETDEDVEYGTTPTYNGETPTKAEDENGRYVFVGWDKNISEVTENVTYTAKYVNYKLVEGKPHIGYCTDGTNLYLIYLIDEETAAKVKASDYVAIVDGSGNIIKPVQDSDDGAHNSELDGGADGKVHTVYKSVQLPDGSIIKAENMGVKYLLAFEIKGKTTLPEMAFNIVMK